MNIKIFPIAPDVKNGTYFKIDIKQTMQELMCCTESDFETCENCPYHNHGVTCLSKLHSDAFALINGYRAEIIRLANKQNQFADIGKMYSEVKAEVIEVFVANLNEAITKIYNKHIFGDNDLNDEEKDAIINFSDDISTMLEKLQKEI